MIKECNKKNTMFGLFCSNSSKWHHCQVPWQHWQSCLSETELSEHLSIVCFVKHSFVFLDWCTKGSRAVTITFRECLHLQIWRKWLWLFQALPSFWHVANTMWFFWSSLGLCFLVQWQFEAQVQMKWSFTMQLQWTPSFVSEVCYKDIMQEIIVTAWLPANPLLVGWFLQLIKLDLFFTFGVRQAVNSHG